MDYIHTMWDPEIYPQIFLYSWESSPNQLGIFFFFLVLILNTFPLVLSHYKLLSHLNDRRNLNGIEAQWDDLIHQELSSKTVMELGFQSC